VEVHSRTEVLLELLEADMRDLGVLVTSESALRYLTTLIGRQLSGVEKAPPPGDAPICVSVKSLRIVDPSTPSTGDEPN